MRVTDTQNETSWPPRIGGIGGRAHLLMALLFALLLAYSPILLWGSFQFDDYNVIVFNPRVQDGAAWWNDLGHGIRPLLKLSYLLNWISDLGVTGFQLTNLAIHAGNCLLVGLLAQQFAALHAPLQALAPRLAASTALLFALHPIQTEAVSYICGRSSALMTSFYLLGLLAWAQASAIEAGCGTAHEQAIRLRRHVFVPLCFLCALAVKETAITFPFALLLWDRCTGQTHHKNHPLRDSLRASWTSWLLLGIVALYVLGNPAYSSHLARSATFNSLSGNLANAALGTSWLLQQWLLPFWLNIDPDLPVAHSLTRSAILPLILLASLLIAAFIHHKHRPWLSFALAWLLLQLLPLHLALPRLDIANERQMYLAGGPLAFGLMAELHLRLAPHKVLRDRLVAGLLLGCLLLGMARNLDYRSEIALWQATARHSPGKARVHNNLGYAYAQAGRANEARHAYQRALQIDPKNVQTRANLANLSPTRPASCCDSHCISACDTGK